MESGEGRLLQNAYQAAFHNGLGDAGGQQSRHKGNEECTPLTYIRLAGETPAASQAGGGSRNRQDEKGPKGPPFGQCLHQPSVAASCEIGGR